MQNQELYINGELCDLSDDTPIAITFQVNNLADLADRQSTYSNTIKLPKSVNNKRILGQAQSDSFTQDAPYVLLPCKLIQNGVEQIRAGVITLQRVSDYFECQITYGIKGVADALKKSIFNPVTGNLVSIEDAKLVDMDWTDIPIFDYTQASVAASQTVTGGTGVLFPIIDYGGTLDTSSTVHTNWMRPGVYFSQILTHIQAYSGYTFSGGKQYTDGLNDFIPFSATVLYDYQGTKWEDTHIQLSVAKNLPDFTLKEILKDYMQRYFLTPVVDNVKKTVVFHSMDELYDNKYKARDWTDKFIDDAREDVFSLSNYAQTNNLKWKEDQKFLTNGDGVFFVKNQNLASTTDLLTSIFAQSATIQNVLAGQNVASIIKFKSSPLTTGETDFTIDTEPRVVRIHDVPGLYNFIDLTGNPGIIGTAKIGTFDDINWTSQVANYGKGLSKLLDKCRVITRYAILTALDVQDFDFFIPVYDRFEAKYYYVNQIVNFVPGKKCKIELIRL